VLAELDIAQGKSVSIEANKVQKNRQPVSMNGAIASPT
jgi:hypothetical protein